MASCLLDVGVASVSFALVERTRGTAVDTTPRVVSYRLHSPPAIRGSLA